jgi:hypothetical protein
LERVNLKVVDLSAQVVMTKVTAVSIALNVLPVPRRVQPVMDLFFKSILDIGLMKHTAKV